MDRVARHGSAGSVCMYIDWPSTHSGRTCTEWSTFMPAWNILNVNVHPFPRSIRGFAGLGWAHGRQRIRFESTSGACWQMDEYLMRKATFNSNEYIWIYCRWPWIDNCIEMRNVTIDNGKQMKLMHSWEMNDDVSCEGWLCRANTFCQAKWMHACRGTVEVNILQTLEK